MTYEEQPAPEPAEEFTDMPRPAEEPAPKEPGRVAQILRTSLRWAVGMMTVFALGVAATWTAQVRPKAQEAQALRSALETALSQVDALEAEVVSLRPLKDENAALKADVAEADRHLELLRVLVDVTSAQLALAEDDPASAGLRLAGTEDRLASLQGKLEGSDAAVIQGLRERLGLVLDELEGDAFAARRDLEILANNLLDLERSLFGE